MNSSDQAQAVKSDIRPKNAALRTNIRLRPTQSASGAISRQPSSRPKRPKAKTGVNCAGPACRSCITAGAT